ncbi:MAG: transposase [Rhodobacteraceae bacterium]|nr:transposase [Paracoccaceae bacterium]
MDHRHLLEENQQSQALKEFTNLQSMKDLVDWDLFTPTLEEVFGPPQTKGKGHSSWDYLIIFRSLLLGVMNGLSDGHLQYMLLDRTSFKQFVGLRSTDQVPDQKTLWKYRNQLSQSGRFDELVAVFMEQLAAHGYGLQTGKQIEATIVPVTRQSNSPVENVTLESGSDGAKK